MTSPLGAQWHKRAAFGQRIANAKSNTEAAAAKYGM